MNKNKNLSRASLQETMLKSSTNADFNDAVEKDKVKILRLTQTKKVDDNAMFKDCKTVWQIYQKGLLTAWVRRWVDEKHFNAISQCKYIVVCMKGDTPSASTLFGKVYKIVSNISKGDTDDANHVYTKEIADFQELAGKEIEWGNAYMAWAQSFRNNPKYIVEQ